MTKPRIAVLTGAGISAESGIKTFRDAGGLWEGHDVMEVASYDGWRRNRELVLNFYNERRKQLKDVQPNRAHYALAELEGKYDVTIITQNVDDLHERGGSTNIIHLHGELLKARSTVDENLVYDWKEDITANDKCDKGSQLRPHIVWFGEAVPLIEQAAKIVRQADIFIVIGTSMVVYPAAGLIHYTSYDTPKFLVDPNVPEMSGIPNLTVIQDKASTGVDKLVKELLSE